MFYTHNQTQEPQLHELKNVGPNNKYNHASAENMLAL